LRSLEQALQDVGVDQAREPLVGMAGHELFCGHSPANAF